MSQARNAVRSHAQAHAPGAATLWASVDFELVSRAPYFHDGSAASIVEAIEFYETRFGIRFTDQEKADRLAFLRSH